MAKAKRVYVCRECGAQTPQWAGRCADCGAWNSLEESVQSSAKPTTAMNKHTGYAGQQQNTVQALKTITSEQAVRWSTGLPELDRVLGGGLVTGSVVLIGGDPGIGKSTLLLQAMASMAELSGINPLYISGEESLQQIRLRAERLQLQETPVDLLAETHAEQMMAIAQQRQPQVMVIDSIQTVFTELLQSAPGTVAQVRESAAQLVRFAKSSGITMILVGHVTKQGALAGPRVLEHMVDTVLYFEGDSSTRFRILRAVKNRFGAVNELGVFAMTELGLKEVSNPSAIFLSRGEQAVPGSMITVIREGSRPMLVEVQALVDESPLGNPRRVSVGLEQNRLAMLLAILHRHGGITCHDQDVFINVVGGVKLSETGADLAVLTAVISSLRNKAIPQDWVVFGEVGLTGEIRPVQAGEERIRDAGKHGFKVALVPAANAPRKSISGLKVIAVHHLQQAIEALKEGWQ
ncbi:MULTISPECIES: DNA repair protein RadA [unclassified Methylophaga]|jgi:DNA repair protein RadA/Sms|uniref:DNA repair protein RadA n=1 Tax=unclassified Methylophaga TaxID=2629249 RepID=UPI000C95C537|nr:MULTISPECIES: DNA repair protein RadA [unclassified Methylophaga]MAY17968.1 DNA repair protein RadA [Methylophaga sp.]|tara:strand:- start:4856 stop:6244 length:1389 start_codon:yes stop_codon:yes gene_type:complete